MIMEMNIMTVNDEKKLYIDPSFVLSKKILWAWRSGGFTSAVVEGPRGIGKSSYSMKILFDVYVCMGYDPEEAWKMALDRCLYRLDDIVTFLDKSTRKQTPDVVLCCDDAAVFGSSMTYFTNFKMVHLLQSMMDTIRGSVSGLIMTCPNQGQLLSFLRRYDSYIVRINHVEDGGFQRRAAGYLWRTLPSGLKRIYPSFNDFFSCRLPNDIFEKYQKKRRKYNKENIESLKRALKDNKKDNDVHETVVVENDTEEYVENLEGDDKE